MNAILAYVTIVVVTSSVLAERCYPGKNCKPPSCRCWMERSIPGNLNKLDTPQIVLLNFGNSINKHTKHYSLELMNELANPNGCPITATFFIEDLNTDPHQVALLYQAGFEVGLSTANDTVPRAGSDWLESIGRVKSSLMRAGIPEYALQGFRAAQLYAGGDEALNVMEKLHISYDATCVNRQYIDTFNLLWPYTYNFPGHAPLCSIGKTPQQPHNGTWQFLMADLTIPVNGSVQNCPSPSSCAHYMKTVDDVFEFLFANFLKHYNGNRAPFNLYLDPLWLTDPMQNKGTRQFLEFLEAISDVWMLTFQQTLDWIKYPVNKQRAINYPSWGCATDAPQIRKYVINS